MPTKRLSSEELWRRGDDWYDHHIRPVVETEENIGKLIQIDVETGDYEMGTDRESIQMSDRLIARHSDAQIIEFRIGYPAVSVLAFPRLNRSKREAGVGYNSIILRGRRTTHATGTHEPGRSRATR